MITMPVTAPYQTVKRYVFKLLAEHPCLALSKMEVKAGHLSANSIDAELIVYPVCESAMKSNRRLKWLLVCMIVIAALLIRERYFQGPAVSSVSRPSAHSEAPSRNHQRESATTDILVLSDRAAYANADGDAFPPVSRPVPAQRVDTVAPPPPPPPKAPLCRSRSLARNSRRAHGGFLSQQDSVLVVTDGLVFLERYKVVKIRPPVMEVLYMPLNEMQTIGIGAPHND
ncbi:MAG: hypothetical protein IPL70_15490 [Uliginosibacterium sp.]|nr:hypothetical protein [Uliginosibacterium sp.]